MFFIQVTMCTGSQREKTAPPFTERSVKYRFHKMSGPAIIKTGSLSLSPSQNYPLLSKTFKERRLRWRWLCQVLTIVTIPSPTSSCSAVLLLFSQSNFFLDNDTSEDSWHFQCMRSYFGVSIIQQTPTARSLTCVCDLLQYTDTRDLTLYSHTIFLI